MSQSSAPLVTVLMPVLRPDPDYLAKAIQSILKQTWPNFEMVVVEDPSEQPGEMTVNGFGDSRVRHICNSVRTSFVQQLNRGITEARGDLIARMDADDISEPNRLAAQVEFMEQNPRIALVGTQLEVIDETGRHLGYRPYPCVHADILRAMPRFCPFAHPSVMYRKADIVRVGGYQRPELHPAEDYDLWSRFAKAGMQLANLPLPLVRYRLHTKAAKTQRLRESLRHTMQVKKTYWINEMGFRDRLRLWQERLLLYMPANVVMWLFRKTQFRHRL